MITNKLRFVSTDNPNIETRKKSMRQRMKERRANNENRDVKEILLTENFLKAVEDLKGAGTRLSYFVYLSYSSEAPTDKLIEELLEGGATVYSPRLENNEMQAVLFGEDFSLSPLGIREPIGKSYKADIDVAAVPLLAVDERGNRLGYGGGYYDRYLAAHPKTLKIGYCFDFQVLKEVPSLTTDVSMDVIVTDKRIIICNKE